MKKIFSLKTIAFVMALTLLYLFSFSQTCVNETTLNNAFVYKQNARFNSGDNNVIRIEKVDGTNLFETTNETTLISFWVYIPNNNTDYQLINMFDATESKFLLTRTSNNKIGVTVGSESYESNVTIGSSTNGGWNHITLILDHHTFGGYDYENRMTLYINGDEEWDISCDINNLKALQIGPWFDGYINGLVVIPNNHNISSNEFDDLKNLRVGNGDFSINNLDESSDILDDVKIYYDNQDVIAIDSEYKIYNWPGDGQTYPTSNNSGTGHVIQPYNNKNLRITERSGTTGDNKFIKLEWDEYEYNNPYHKIYRKLSSESGYGDLMCITKDKYYIDNTFELNEEYIYTVIPTYRNEDWQGNPLSLTTLLYDDVSSVNIEDAGGGRCDGKVKISWNPPCAITDCKYNIYKKVGSLGVLEQIETDYFNANDEYVYTASLDEYGVDMQLFMDVNNDDLPVDDIKNLCDSYIVVANQICTNPPTNLVSAIDNSSIELTWDFTQASPPATSYNIYRKETGFDWELILDSYSIDNLSYLDNESLSCKEYQYKVEAYNTCGGAESSASNLVTIPNETANIFNTSEAYFDASKGYYTSKVQLEWQANEARLSDIEQYEIYRRKTTETYSLLATIENANATSYEDNTAEAGIFYEYLIRTSLACGASSFISDSLETVGFRYNIGIVSGKVVYEGGNAVKDAEILIHTDEEIPSSCLSFSGSTSYPVCGLEIINPTFLSNSINFEAWIKPDNDISGLEKNLISISSFNLSLKNMRPIVTSQVNTDLFTLIQADTVLNSDTWYHLAVVLNQEANLVNLYLNGELIGTAVCNQNNLLWNVDPEDALNDSLFIGGNSDNDRYKGKIDEFRFWKNVRSEEEISRDYKRILSGKEDGIMIYYHFNENYGNGIYDISKTGNEFNKNDIDMNIDSSEDLEWSTETPSYNQLHYSGITDQNGDYVAEGICYSGSGNIFKVTPSLGIHEFSPSTINLFIGDGANVHNNIDFIDESSFQFIGEVLYNGTNIPVEDAYIYIDNQQLFDAGGIPIATNETGLVDISVPIGEHFVTIKKDKHLFENNGQWPAPTEFQDYPTFNFQEDISIQTFLDTTTVEVVGRFVGGDVEGNKKPGLGLSNANIGIGEIVLKNEQGNDIDIDPEHVTDILTFETDSETGEYRISLLPIQYKIQSVGSPDFPDYAIDELDLGLLDLRNIPEMSVAKDTTYIEMIIDEDTVTSQHIDSVMYHFKRNFIYYEDPEIVVTGLDGLPLSGDAEYIYKNDETGIIDTIDLNSGVNFKYPVFSMGKTYDIEIGVFSIYTNPITDALDTVAIKDAELSITNNLEIGQPTHILQTDSSGFAPQYNSFRVGMPSMSKNEANQTSFTKTMSITAVANNQSVTWTGGNDLTDPNIFRGYVLGCVDADGANFVTYGPEIPKFILRDPPGDASYTTLEEGSSYSISKSYNFGMGTAAEYDSKLNLGVDFSFGGGLLGPIVTVENENNITAGIRKESSYSRDGQYTETYTFTRTFSTSSDPSNVGSMADVYVGEASNFFFSEALNLKIYPKENYLDDPDNCLGDVEMENAEIDFTIGTKPSFAMTGDTTSTFFIYTQGHILNNLIPTYRELIESLLLTADYTSNLPTDHDYYGMANDSILFPEEFALENYNPSYTYTGTGIDSVAFLNEQISIWVQTIAMNEAAKIEPVSNFETIENISFDANAGEYSSSVTQSLSTSNSNSYDFSFGVYGGSQFGFAFNGLGFELSSETTTTTTYNASETVDEETSLTWTYVIDDTNSGDYFSFDIMYKDNNRIQADKDDFVNLGNYPGLISLTVIDGALSSANQIAATFSPIGAQISNTISSFVMLASYAGVMGHHFKEIDDYSVSEPGFDIASPIFKIRGGQSRCPYEGEEYTMIALDSVTALPALLTIGTQCHEAPKIAIEPASIVNVPDGSPAVFQLSLMNESPTGSDMTYVLSLDEATNPDGAQVRIDGMSPNRPFFIPYGETITKTLTVEKGASSVMDYNDLMLVFHSECQFDLIDNFPEISDTVTFSVSFVPVCTDVNFENIEDEWVVNIANEDILTIYIDSYNINHPTFQKIYFQSQQSGATPTPVLVLYNDTVNTDWLSFTGNKLYIDGQSEISFDWDVSALNDGEYRIFLTSTCSDGSINESEQLTGVIDRIAPSSFGNPEPADGILSYGEDISILFNEPINTGQMYNFGQFGSQSYISVRGVLNGTDLINSESLLHDANIHFDGEDDYMKINNVNLNYTDFTIEFWAKRQELGTQSIIDLGDFNIGFNSSDNFVVEFDGQTVTSEAAFSNLDVWSFYSITYHIGDENIEESIDINVLDDATTHSQTQEVNYYSSLDGTMYVGNNNQFSQGFNGNIHELRIWNYARNLSDIVAQKGQILNGYEQGLYSLFPMNEAYGDIAKDIAFGRNAHVNASWQVSRNGKAIELDGTNVLTIPIQSMALCSQADFTLEFWYKTSTPSQISTLLSSGNPDEESNINSWNIEVTPENNILISNNGELVTINAENYIDNNWHHLAISLNRLGYLSTYIDGDLINTHPVNNFAGFGGANLVAGARWYNLSMIDYFDQYLTGFVDEIRFWNSARTQDQIQRYMNHTIYGDEPGLKAYFPFEDVTIEDPSICNETLLNFSMDTIGIAGDATMNELSFTLESPLLKLQRPEVLIPHNITLSSEEIVITPNVEDYKIENQILDISVKNAKDLNNNIMASTANWTVFIDKNNVVWDMQELDIEKFVEDETSVTVNIRNKGGLNENYTITNIPSWMDVTPSSGTLLPLETKEIEIKINPELNIGTYQRDLNLVASMDFNERISLNIKVKAHAPDWDVSPEDYLNTSNIIGQLSIGNVLSTDEEDIVACFVGNDCRGIANLEYFDNLDIYLCFMNIYSNSNGETITFKVFDASTGNVFSNVSPSLIFESNSIYGSISEPLQINATNYVDQEFDLNTGWNWISFNVYSNQFDDLNTALENLYTESGDFIKSQSVFSSVNDLDEWQGSLSGLDILSTYKLKVNNSQSFHVSGYRVLADTVEIPIVSGWNWIGYPLSIQKTIMDALSSLNPTENDVIKSQHQFAVYSNLQGWIGSLTYLQPGEGYVMYSSNNGTLEYSSGVSAKSFVEFEDDSDLPNTEQNMTIVAALDIDNPDLYNVFAYDENGLCGNASPVQMNDGSVRFFITINSTSPETIRFEAKYLYRNLKANEIVSFKANEMLGNLDEPILLTFGDNGKSLFSEVYPNPFRDNIELKLYLNSSQKVQMKLYNSLGTEISAVDIELSKGIQKLELFEILHIDKTISDGVYMFKLQYNGKEELIKIVKQ